jgi:hypothetical protein
MDANMALLHAAVSKSLDIDSSTIKRQYWFFIAVFFSITLFYGCERNITSSNPGPVYFNSFESNKDVAGWERISQADFRKEAPSGGGVQSLHVSGGCDWPHASFVLPAFRNNGHFIVQCWGKNLMIGGSIKLNIEGNEADPGISLSINSPDWTFYRSTDALYCPANRKLKLTLGAGGLVASAMLVDLIEIIKVK